MLELVEIKPGYYSCNYRHSKLRATLTYVVSEYRRPGVRAWQGTVLREGDVIAIYEATESFDEVVAWAEKTAAGFDVGRAPL